MVLIFNGKDGIINCVPVKFIEHGLNVVEGMLEVRLCKILSVTEL